MARFHVPNTVNSVSKQQLSTYIAENFKERVREKPSEGDEGSQYCNDISSYSFDFTEEEKKKHEFYENVHQIIVAPNGGEWVIQEQNLDNNPEIDVKATNILDNLTRDDIQRLIETEDEFSQNIG